MKNKMKKNHKHLNLVVAVVFAIIIMTIGYAMRGHEDKFTVIMFVIALWFVPYNYLNQKPKGNSCNRIVNK